MNHSTEDILNLDALTFYIVESDGFCEAIGKIMKTEVESLVESAVGEYDFNQMVRDEMPDYGDDITGIEEEMSRLRDEVEDRMNTDLMAEHSTLIQALQEQNKNFFFALAAAEERLSSLQNEVKELDQRTAPILTSIFRLIKLLIKGPA